MKGLKSRKFKRLKPSPSSHKMFGRGCISCYFRTFTLAMKKPLPFFAVFLSILLSFIIYLYFYKTDYLGLYENSHPLFGIGLGGGGGGEDTPKDNDRFFRAHNYFKHDESFSSKALISREKCSIPDYPLWNKDAMEERENYRDLSVYNCGRKTPRLTYVDKDVLVIDTRVLESLKLTMNDVSCCYRTIAGEGASPDELADKIYKFSKCIPLTESGTKMSSMFVVVHCVSPDSILRPLQYHNFHAVPLLLPEVKRMDFSIDDKDEDIGKKMYRSPGMNVNLTALNSMSLKEAKRRSKGGDRDSSRIGMDYHRKTKDGEETKQNMEKANLDEDDSMKNGMRDRNQREFGESSLKKANYKRGVNRYDGEENAKKLHEVPLFRTTIPLPDDDHVKNASKKRRNFQNADNLDAKLIIEPNLPPNDDGLRNDMKGIRNPLGESSLRKAKNHQVNRNAGPKKYFRKADTLNADSFPRTTVPPQDDTDDEEEDDDEEKDRGKYGKDNEQKLNLKGAGSLKKESKGKSGEKSGAMTDTNPNMNSKYNRKSKISPKNRDDFNDDTDDEEDDDDDDEKVGKNDRQIEKGSLENGMNNRYNRLDDGGNGNFRKTAGLKENPLTKPLNSSPSHIMSYMNRNQKPINRKKAREILLQKKKEEEKARLAVIEGAKKAYKKASNKEVFPATAPVAFTFLPRWSKPTSSILVDDGDNSNKINANSYGNADERNLQNKEYHEKVKSKGKGIAPGKKFRKNLDDAVFARTTVAPLENDSDLEEDEDEAENKISQSGKRRKRSVLRGDSGSLDDGGRGRLEDKLSQEEDGWNNELDNDNGQPIKSGPPRKIQNGRKSKAGSRLGGRNYQEINNANNGRRLNSKGELDPINGFNQLEWNNSSDIAGISKTSKVGRKSGIPPNPDSDEDADDNDDWEPVTDTNDSMMIKPKPSVKIKRLPERTTQWEYWEGKAKPGPKSDKKANKAKPSSGLPHVLIIGIDSTSRVNFRRFMKLSVKALKDVGAIEMRGFTKVGHNALSNVLPLLTSYSLGEINSFCRKNNSKQAPLDKCPFIWKEFAKLQYLTAHLEDDPHLSSFRFAKEHTHFNLKPFMMAAYAHHQGKRLDFGNSIDCIGYERPEEIVLKFSQKLIRSAVNVWKRPTFTFTWLKDLTNRKSNSIHMMDEQLSKIITGLNTEGILNNTLLIMMSDHGYRFDPFRRTLSGWYEDKLPVLWMRAPSTYEEEEYRFNAALIHNSKQLITPYDLHATLKHVLKKNRRQLNVPVPYSGKSSKKGISLFTKVPPRSCQEAGIPSEHCPCNMKTDYDIPSKLVYKALKAANQHLNRSLLPQCLSLKMKKVLGTAVLVHPRNMNSFKLEKELMTGDILILLAVAQPGELIIENGLVYDKETKTFQSTNHLLRTNRIGDKGDCISRDDPMYEFCKCAVKLGNNNPKKKL